MKFFFFVISVLVVLLTVHSALGVRIDVALTDGCELKIFNDTQNFVLEEVTDYWNVTSCGTEFRTNFNLESGVVIFNQELMDSCKSWLGNNSDLPGRLASCMDDRGRFNEQRENALNEMNKFRVANEELEKVVADEKKKVESCVAERGVVEKRVDGLDRDVRDCQSSVTSLPSRGDYDAIKNSRNTWAVIGAIIGGLATWGVMRWKEGGLRKKLDANWGGYSPRRRQDDTYDKDDPSNKI